MSDESASIKTGRGLAFLRHSKHALAVLLLGLIIRPHAEAASPDAVVAGLGGALLFGSTTAANRLEQIYYLGTFDPDNRVPPTFFRIRVRGQSSLLSRMKFGSGWVPAAITDSLADNISYSATAAEAQVGTSAATKRPFGARLQQYGPEGFRVVPDDQRLVIVMGSSPEAFFAMVDQFVGTIAGVKADQGAVSSDLVFLKGKIVAVAAEQTELVQTKKNFTSLLEDAK